jgi:hypothetical protein
MNIKMKKIGLLLLLLITTSLQAQIQKMSELSQNKFLDSEIIYEENGEDIWGYFLLYKGDMVSKDFLKLEYIVLDKNLNKVGSNTFEHDYYDSWIADIMPDINSIIKSKNELILAIGFDYDEILNKKNYAFRRINLNDFSVGNTFFYFADKRIEDNKIMDRLIDEKKDPTSFKPIKSYGFLKSNFTAKDYRKLDANINNVILKKYVYDFLDLNFNKKWGIEFNKIDNGYDFHSYFESNDKIIIFFKSRFGKAFKNIRIEFYKIIDINSGEVLFEIPLSDSKNTYLTKEVVFQGDNIIFYEEFSEFKKGAFFDKSLGITKRTFNLTTKSMTDQKFFYWTDLISFIKIDKYGKVNNSDFIQLLDFKLTSNGKTLIIGESYESARNTKTKNLYTLELDSDLKVSSFNEILKNVNKYLNLDANGSQLENYKLFDFMYSQKITNDEFIYFYQDNEKGKKNKIWTLGAIVYADGKFSNQKINLKTESGIIKPIKAKKGYIILQETSDKNENTIRLEKIEY